MANTVKPALQPTGNCIWNSFHELQPQFGYRHIFLTGDRGSGKSTLYRELKSSLPTVDSITTWAEPRKAVFAQINKETPVMIGFFDPTTQGAENRMKPCPEGLKMIFDTLNLLADSNCEWVTIDEIGYLETVDKAYCEALVKLLDRKQVLAVVRKQEIPFLTGLLQRTDAFVIDLDEPPKTYLS